MAEPCRGFRETQYAFAAAIRNRDIPSPPGVATARMSLYRELFFNNIQSFIASGFPVLRGLLDESSWQALLSDFFSRHRCTTPYFSGIPAEFLAFLRDERGAHPDDPPFLLELAHYEWVELALSIAEEETPAPGPEGTSDPLDCAVALSPNAWPLTYRFPVHRICRDFQPEEPPPEPTYLTVYRDRDDRVRFMEVNAATYRLLDLIAAEPALSARTYLERIALELSHPDAASLFAYGTELFRNLAERGVVAST